MIRFQNLFHLVINCHEEAITIDFQFGNIQHDFSKRLQSPIR